MTQRKGTSLVVGGGMFGVTASRELQARGWQVTLVDPGPIPHPLAASTDISKIVRLAYGSDETYTELMEEAMETWREWNRGWPEPLFHETGVLMLTRSPMAPGSFEYESFRVLEERRRRPLRLTPADLRKRFPGWKAQSYVDGFFQSEGGYAESGRVVARLVELASAERVSVRPDVSVAGLLEEGNRVTGIQTSRGERLLADQIILAVGAWTSKLLPHLAGSLTPSAHPIYHFRPPSKRLYTQQLFPVFTADISATGWYGFPINRDGIVKISNHGTGHKLDPDIPRQAPADDETALRRFLDETFPTLAPVPIVEKRWCFYCDTRDEHFWIDRDPQREGLIVAAGDSGHAFKFAPVMGRLIADAVEDVPSPWRQKFRWRPDANPPRGEEEARHHG
ncbi:MAG: FAD-dependent oxidoreductase [Acidobacteria bacterium]|nr:FAD-dependent oxidoreductase [Acidobacteriota bacterium]MCI0566583.1 FAD-dependent oxidoreductase [Acidobacteriota bacterium]